MAQDPDVVIVTATLTKPQLRALLTAFPRLHLRRLRLAVLVWVMATVLTAVVDLVSFGGVQPTSLVISAVTAAAVAVLLLAGPWLQSRRAAERAGVGVATTWTFTAAGVTTRSVLGEGEVGWDRVADLRRTGEVVAMLWTPQMCATGLPAAAMDPADFATLAAWWRAGGATATPEGAGDPSSWGGPAWDDSVVVRGPMTLAAVRRMQWALLPTSLLVLFAVAVLAVVVPVLVPVLLGGPGTLRRSDLGGLVLAGAVGLGVPLLLDALLRRGVRRVSGGDTLWRATPAGLSLRTPLGRSEVPWARVARVVESRGFLVASTGRPRTAIAMPIASLSSDDLAAVRRWAAAQGARVPGATSVPPPV